MVSAKFIHSTVSDLSPPLCPRTQILSPDQVSGRLEEVMLDKWSLNSKGSGESRNHREEIPEERKRGRGSTSFAHALIPPITLKSVGLWLKQSLIHTMSLILETWAVAVASGLHLGSKLRAEVVSG